MEIIPIPIFGPRFFEGNLKEINMTTNPKLKYAFIHNCSLVPNSTINLPSKRPYEEVIEIFYKNFGIVSVKCIPAIHCVDSYCIIIEHETGWKMAYSGDTRPSKLFAKEAKGCHILIHEASMKTQDYKKVLKKGHTTVMEALKISKLINPYRTILTHFSQRQAYIPVGDFYSHKDKLQLSNYQQKEVIEFRHQWRDSNNVDYKNEFSDTSLEEVDRNTIIFSFDLMTIDFTSLPFLPYMISPLLWLYEYDKGYEEDKL